ncbi:hypothetical protein [Streptomyces sp. NPDC002994]|uniref:hypothetical protein n=1 Tax=Streptomyces sp. NPDC002994 TaxID=3154441 RepID=UPI0033AD3819
MGPALAASRPGWADARPDSDAGCGEMAAQQATVFVLSEPGDQRARGAPTGHVRVRHRRPSRAGDPLA